MTIGQRIKAMRETKKLSQTKLAKLANMSQSGLSSIESGASSPKEDNLRAIASALQTTVSILVGETETTPRPIIRDEDIKFALFGGENEITDAQFEEVKRYARYIKEREAGDK